MSVIARAAPSCIARRRGTCFSLSLVGFTRLVNSTTNKSSSGSIQIEVPVKPVCPNAAGVK